MDDQLLHTLMERLDRLERQAVRYRQGEVTDDSPLSVALGGSDVPLEDIRAIDGAPLAIGDIVGALAWAQDLLVLGRVGDGAGAGFDIGDLKPTARGAAPAGWLLCQGQSLLRADYPGLFTAIGTTYGAVDGTHFTLPDLRGRVPLGAGTGTGLTARALAATGGAETVTLSAAESGVPAHGHTTAASATTGGASLAHSHAVDVDVALVTGGGAGIAIPDNAGGGSLGTVQSRDSGSLTHDHTIPSLTVNNNSAAAAANAHNNMQPFLAINWLIKT